MRNIRGGVHRSKSVIPVVGEPRRVPQEVANGDLSRRRDCVGRAGRRLNQHFWILELWQIFRDRVLQEEVALFVQHHHRHAGDGFGHRADAEHRVGTHRLTGLPVHHPLWFEPDHAPSARHQSNRTGNPLFIDASLDGRADALQAFRRHAHGFGLGHGQVLCKRGGRDRHADEG